ncbi:hypothetical protein BDN72DRAFT_753719 [Pluteus cervinus]|uniref:Uncharacterized protein n=1 Tax=Pluteus cervinus TaxID=181527 RepID=A0ACD3BGK6_9AGAR|nr:hypothetical protein BDN72DRAFT_753719 [Pluteus cervinus]
MLRLSASCLRSLSSRAAYATVSQTKVLSQNLPPPSLGGKEVISSLLDQEILKALRRPSPKTISLHDVFDQYSSNASHILDFHLPNESVPRASRRPLINAASTDISNEMVLVAHCVKSERTHEITISSGFALETPENTGETLVLTCAHTLEQLRQTLPSFKRDSTSSPPDDIVSGTFVISSTNGSLDIHPVTRVASALPRSDLILLGCNVPGVKTLPLALYPAQKGTSVRAHLVAHHKPAESGWQPWIGGTWRKWARGTVLGYRDFAGREAEPGTYDALSHLFFTPLPSEGSSGGPIIDEETGAVIGIMLGTRMDSRVEGLKGWGVPSEVVYEVRWCTDSKDSGPYDGQMFSLPMLGRNSRVI